MHARRRFLEHGLRARLEIHQEADFPLRALPLSRMLRQPGTSTATGLAQVYVLAGVYRGARLLGMKIRRRLDR